MSMVSSDLLVNWDVALTGQACWLSLYSFSLLLEYIKGRIMFKAKKKCPYYKEKYNFQFCEALQDKPEFFGLGRLWDGSHTSEEDKLLWKTFPF